MDLTDTFVKAQRQFLVLLVVLTDTRDEKAITTVQDFHEEYKIGYKLSQISLSGHSPLSYLSAFTFGEKT